MLGTGWSFFLASKRAERRGRMAHPLPRGDQIGQGVVSRSACTSALPPCCSSVVWPTPGVPRTSITRRRCPAAGARPASVSAWPHPAGCCPAPPCSARLDTTPLGAREPHDRLGGTSLTRWRHPVPGGPRVTRRRPGPFARSGRCKSNGTRHLHGPVRRIRSSACRLRSPTFPRPARRESSCQRKRKRSSVGFAG